MQNKHFVILFDHYSNLVVELEKSTFFEWVYEEEAEATVKQIHDLIASESMRSNILRDLFTLKVYDLDR